MSPRPQIDHIRKPQLLDAAAAVIAERGMAATRIADVAERAGTSPPGVLYWFESRDELLAQALSSAERTFHDELAAQIGLLEDPRAQLATLIERSVGGDEWVLWMEIWILALRDPAMSQTRQRLDVGWRAQIASIIGDGQASGCFSGPDPERVALEIASLIDGLAVQVALGDRLVTPELMRSTCIEAAERVLEVTLPTPVEAAA